MHRPILFLAGPHASGKTELAQHLAHTYGHSFIDLGPTMRAAHQTTNPELSFGDWVRQGEDEHGPDFTNAVAVRAVKRSLVTSESEKPLVIGGSRSYVGLRYLATEIDAKDHRTMYVDAPEDHMLQRYRLRENRPHMTADEFAEILARDKAMGLESIRCHADWVTYNCGSLATFYAVATAHLTEWVNLQ